MNLKVLTTSREIREYLKKFNNEITPKIMSIGEFLDKSIIVDDRKFVDEYLKKFYLFRAVENIDIEKLGIKKEFLSFFKSSESILGFFNEIYLEKANLDEVELADTYEEYKEHLDILKEIYKNYKNILKKDGFVDKITIEDFRINKNFLSQFENIDIEVLGYLTKFDIDILKKISDIKPVSLRFIVTKYNKNLIKKMFEEGFDKEGRYRIDFKTKDIIDFKEFDKKIDVEVNEFSDRINQVNFVLASIEEFVNEGLKPENIAVILPDEEFGEYLKLFKEKEFNINFAFGYSFEKSDFYIKLKSLYDYLVTKDEISYKKCEDWIEDFENIENLKDLIAFFESKLTNVEKMVSEEEFFKIKKITPFLEENREKFIHFLLDRLKNLSFDDTTGGKITAMGVLESRGVEFDGVIIVDFNEGIVPNINDKDFFLNSKIRKMANLPTRSDKEALQKNYYFNLLMNAKKVKISYVKNDENNPSRFLFELNLKEGKNRDNYYKDVLFRFNNSSRYFSYDKREFKLISPLTPTSFYDLFVCSRRYYFKNILNIKNDIEEKEEIFGLIFHKAIERVVKENRFNSSDGYFRLLMQEILKNREKKDIFEIRSSWEDKIKRFCNIDFKRAKNFINTESFGSKKLNEIVLSAKYDRLDKDFIYDYKTGKKPKENFSKDYIQALFYNYIFEKPALFYYIKDEKRVEEIFEHENPKKALEDMINDIEFIVKETNDIKNCKYCDYRFVCGRE